MKQFWKKGLALILATLAVASISACGKNGDDDDDKSSGGGGKEEQTHVHTYAESSRTMPTCTKQGQRVLSCRCGDRKTEIIGRVAHDMVDGVCDDCGAAESKRLRIVLADSRSYYIVEGMGTCTDTDIIIPSTRDGLPVRGIKANAFSRNADIKSINIPETITEIAVGAFDKCSNLSAIIVDEDNYEYCSYQENLYTRDMETIVRYANGKTDVAFEFPEEVKVIAETAFCDAKSLTSISIPSTISEIGSGAFAMCTSLKNVRIYKGVTTIGRSPFSYCDNLMNIAVDPKNTEYQSIDGNLYTKDGTVLLQYAIGKTEESFVVPEGVAIIGESAVANNNKEKKSLKKIELPASLTEIEGYAFFNYSSITSITFAGDTVQWKTIANKAKNNYWAYGTSVGSITCSNGSVILN